MGKTADRHWEERGGEERVSGTRDDLVKHEDSWLTCFLKASSHVP